MLRQYRKKLSSFDYPGKAPFPQIDTAFPIEEANKIIEKESFNKHLFRPNTYLHKWWARRSGTAFRYILKQLVKDSARRDYYSAGGLEGQVIYDPMIGGGTTLHEAIRLGSNVVGVDIDPIPILQAKATLTDYDIGKLNTEFTDLFEYLNKTIGDFYRTKCPICSSYSSIQFSLYGLRKRCACGEVVVVDSYIIREEKSNNVTISPTETRLATNDKHSCELFLDAPIIEKSNNKCPNCDKPLKELLDVPYAERYYPLIISGNCGTHGQFYKTLDDFDHENLDAAKLASKFDCKFDLSSLKIQPGPKSNDLLKRNIRYFSELFTPRQLLFIKNSTDYLASVQNPQKLLFALLVSTSLDFNSLLCGYKGAHIRRPGAIRHVFSHHAYSFPYTALENNPIFTRATSGTLTRLYRDRIMKAIEWSRAPIERIIYNGASKKLEIVGEIDSGFAEKEPSALKSGKRKYYLHQGDAGKFELPQGSVDFVVTDPPYFDNVQYSDLSNFFRVWLQHLLPDEANWKYAETDSAVSNEANAKGTYANMLARIWRNCYVSLKPPHGRLIFTFHHWNSQAWAELAISLLEADFKLVNFYVIKAENPTSVHIQRLNSLQHDCILVCAPGNWSSNARVWHETSPSQTSDSREFLRTCSEVVGWILQEAMDQEDVYQLCDTIIGAGNGSTSR